MWFYYSVLQSVVQINKTDGDGGIIMQDPLNFTNNPIEINPLIPRFP